MLNGYNYRKCICFYTESPNGIGIGRIQNTESVVCKTIVANSIGLLSLSVITPVIFCAYTLLIHKESMALIINFISIHFYIVIEKYFNTLYQQGGMLFIDIFFLYNKSIIRGIIFLHIRTYYVACIVFCD